MKNLEKLIYTYEHRKIVEFLANKYMNDEELLKRIKMHDMDKMYLMLFYDSKTVSKTHRTISKHHDNELEKDYLDYVEMVLDWESARYTKPDKPLNAYDTLYKYYPHLEEKILPILKKFNIDKSNLPMEEDVVEYFNTIKNVDADLIKEELINYIKEI